MIHVNTKEELLNAIELGRCMFTDENSIQCNNAAEFKHEHDRKYCNDHHIKVNEINKQRRLEANKILKEKINKYLNQRIEQFDAEMEEALRKNKELQKKFVLPANSSFEDINEAQKQKQIYLAKKEASNELEWLKNQMNAGDFDE